MSASAALVAAICGAGGFVSVHATATGPDPADTGDDADWVCPSFVRIWNRLGHAQNVFGALSIVACGAVIAVLYGHNYTRRSLRDRILMGMFALNIMFSVGNTIPMNSFTTGDTPTTCGHFASSPATVMVGLGLFFGAKYGMVLYELFIVSASLMSLRTGKTEMTRRTEITAHTVCVLVGLGLFVGWSVHWTPRFPAELDAMNTAITALLRAWLFLLAAVVVLWGWSRLVLRQLELEWDEALVETTAQMDRDLWKTEDPHVNGQRIQKRRLLDLRREGYRDVAKPLESYIAVFVLFSAPAIVMATDYCAASTDDQTIPYRCDIVAQMVLSMRSLATAFVYFCDRDRRDDLCDFRVLCRKVWRRLKADARLCAGTATGGRDVARGTRDGYRLHFNKDLDVQEFGAADSFTGSSMRSDGSGPLHATNGHEDADGGVSYQLIEDDNWAA